jgi:hypothetical protein
MNELIKHVTPLTRGIIWLAQDEKNVQNPRYAEIDYLLDGLLTANLKASPSVSSRVIVGQNFNHSLYIMVASEIVPSEFNSFVSLLKNLTPENDILVIDETNSLAKIKPQLASLTPHLRIIE